jgi:hypothetical protein
LGLGDEHGGKSQHDERLALHFGASTASTAIGRTCPNGRQTKRGQQGGFGPLWKKPLCPFRSRQRPGFPRPKNSITPAPDPTIACIPYSHRKQGEQRRQCPPRPSPCDPQRSNHARAPHQEIRALPTIPVRHEDDGVKVHRRQSMRSQIGLSGAALQRGKPQTRLAIKTKQEPNKPVAQSAFAIEKQHGRCRCCSERMGRTSRLVHGGSVGGGQPTRKRKRRGCDAAPGG